MIRLLVADDQALVRAGLRRLVETEGDFDLVGEAADGEQAVDLVARCRPDVVLMDVRMPRLDGIAATRRIVAQAAEIKVIVLTTYDLDEYVFDALRAGASGFVLKDTDPDALLNGIRIVAAGDGLLSPTTTRRLISEFARTPDRDRRDDVPGLAELTAREHQVLRLIGLGLTNAEIATELVISSATVKTHVRHVLMKLSARDRVHAVVLAHHAGVV